MSETIKWFCTRLLVAYVRLPCACYYVGSPPKKIVNLVQRKAQKSLFRQLNYYLTPDGKLEPIVMEHASGRSLGIITVIQASNRFITARGSSEN